MARRRRKRKKKRKLSAEERRKKKLQRDHKKEIRSVFDVVGFKRIKEISDFEFSYQDTTSDFDDAFLFENVIALVEYTAAQESGISDHLKRKKVLFDKILKKPADFINFLDENISGFRTKRGNAYDVSQYKIVVLYCSIYSVKRTLKQEVPGPIYLDFPIAKYFRAVTAAIKQSSRAEFLHFLGLKHDEIGKNIISAKRDERTTYAGSLLPETHSHFKKGFKVVSFYVDPEALLNRCYVLRKDGWIEKSSLYQRMISKSKIEAIRKYLIEQRRVFINNIIVTLPSATKLLNERGDQLDPGSLTKTTPVHIQLPADYNSIGLVDGQHRVFSYYEGGANEPQIKLLRQQQNLLVTGIVYPSTLSTADKIKFEATLFLEINANQTNAKSDIKQAIGLLLKPFSPESIAKEVVNHLNDGGPLANEFERYFFEKGKLKTTSVVSYGIRPIVKLDGEDSFFKAWQNSRKSRLVSSEDRALLENYIDFCVGELNVFLGAIRANLPSDRWTADKLANGLLTTTNVNGFIVCLRRIIQNDKLHAFEYYKRKLSGLSSFNFKTYKSSQYGSMGDALYEKHFS